MWNEGEKGENTRSEYITQQQEYLMFDQCLMFDGPEKQTKCRYKLCTVSSGLKTTSGKKKTKTKIDSDLFKYCECYRVQENFW